MDALPTLKKSNSNEELTLDGRKFEQELEQGLQQGLESHSRIMMLLSHFKEAEKQQLVKLDFDSRLDRLKLKTNTAREKVTETEYFMKLHSRTLIREIMN